MKIHSTISLLLVLLLVGCSGAPADATPGPLSGTETPSPAPHTPTVLPPVLITPRPSPGQMDELRLWLPWEGQDIEALGRVIELFSEEYPNVIIRLTYVPEAEMVQRLRSASAGEGPTILLAGSGSAPALWASGRIQDITDLVTTEIHANLQPIAWEQSIYNARLVALPISLKGVLLYRNRELAPQRADTVEELVEEAAAFRSQGLAMGAALDFGFIFSASQLHACDGAIYAADGSMGFGGRAGRCWLELLSLLGQAGRVVVNSDVDMDLFTSGASAWLIDLAENAIDIASGVGEENLAIDAWPEYAATGSSMTGFVWTENAYFPSELSQAEMDTAWAFADFLLTPQIQLILANPQGAGRIPVHTALELEYGFQIQVLGALVNGIPLPLNASLQSIRGSLESAVRLVVREGADPLVALSVLIAETSAILPTPQPTPDGG